MAIDSRVSSDGFFAELREWPTAHQGPDLVDDVELVFEREAARTGEADSAAEQVLGHLAAVARATGIKWLKVHGLPHGAGLGVGGIERVNELIARAAETPFVDQEATQPVCVEAVRGLRHERDAGKIGKAIAIAECDGAPLTDAEVEDFKLAATDAGEDVAHAVVVPEFGVLVGDPGIARLLGPEASLGNPGMILRNQHAATGGGDDLVQIGRAWRRERSHI